MTRGLVHKMATPVSSRVLTLCKFDNIRHAHRYVICGNYMEQMEHGFLDGAWVLRKRGPGSYDRLLVEI